MELVVHIASFSTVVAQIATLLIPGEVHREESATSFEFQAAQFQDVGPILECLGCKSCQGF